MPSAMPAEIAERLSDVSEGPQEVPDFAETDDLHGVVCKDLAAPIARLFSTRDEILTAKRIGGLNQERALEWLLRDLSALERSLYQLWTEA